MVECPVGKTNLILTGCGLQTFETCNLKLSLQYLIFPKSHLTYSKAFATSHCACRKKYPLPFYFVIYEYVFFFSKLSVITVNIIKCAHKV